MVLLDSTAPATAAKPRATSPGDGGSYNIMGRVSIVGRVSALSRSRLDLVWGLYGQLDYRSMPRSLDEVRARMATASHVRNTIGEFIQATASMDQAASLGDFADEPLVALTAAAENAAWLAALNEMASSPPAS